MRLIIKEDYVSVSDWVSEYIKNKINNCNNNKFVLGLPNNKFVLGLPTGSTPLGVYQNLIRDYNNNELSFKNVVSFNMDEYVNIPEDNSESYHYYMYNNFFNHIDIPKNNINILNGNTSNLDEECNNYEFKIKQNEGIDLFLCGIGADGHLAFNEPASSLLSRTRVKTLCPQTIKDNSRFFDNNINLVPKTVLTVGIATIMDAKEIIVMITGANKAMALYKCIEEGITHMWTASALQNHPNVIIVCDEAATLELKVKTVNYFKHLELTSDIMGKPLNNYYFNSITQTDRIIIFSPHPDDDVIGMGGAMQLFPNKNNVIIAYMTSGKGGIPKDMPANTRQKEAKFSIKILGYSADRARFLNLPFYENKVPPSSKDYDILNELYKMFKPNHIFICGDNDPNGTHRTCYNVVKYSNIRAIDTLIKVWIYIGAWNTWGNNIRSNYNPNCTIHIPKKLFDFKKLAIQAHQSQEPPVITNEDKRTFVQRMMDSNMSKKIIGEYVEQFLCIDVDEFLLRDFN